MALSKVKKAFIIFFIILAVIVALYIIYKTIFERTIICDPVHTPPPG